MFSKGLLLRVVQSWDCVVNSKYLSTKQQVLDSSKLKEFADDNFKFDENGAKFSKRVENTVGKGEIARAPFPTVFSKYLKGRHIKTRTCMGKG